MNSTVILVAIAMLPACQAKQRSQEPEAEVTAAIERYAGLNACRAQ